MPDRNVALVVGSSGLVGGSIAAYLHGLPGWEVIGVSRRPSASPAPGWRHEAIDLLDAAACERAAERLKHVTHVFYAGRAPAAEPAGERAANAAMLRNLITALEPVATGLRHVSLLHGTKWYGSHLGPYRTPAREDDPRAAQPNFYHDHVDWLAERQRGRGWTWSSLRPHIVCGVSVGYPYNLVTTLGAYAGLCGAKGRPMTFPGTPECWNSVSQATDVGLLARAAAWAATEPGCAGQSFNIVNADYFRWRDLWPSIAAAFGVEPGGVETRSLAAEFEADAPLWTDIVRRDGLLPLRLEQIANGAFADFLFSAGWDDMSSTAKIRRFGFGEVVETEPMFDAMIAEMRRRRIAP